jgi:hypothetical protein
MIVSCEISCSGPHDWKHKSKMQVVHARNQSGKQSLSRHCQKLLNEIQDPTMSLESGSGFLSELEGPTSAQRTHPYVWVKKGRRQKRQLNGEIQQVADILWVIQPRRLTQPQRFRVSLPKCAPYTPQISCNPKEPLSILHFRKCTVKSSFNPSVGCQVIRISKMLQFQP